MSGVINSLTEVIICSGVLYANYYFLLRNKKFHLYNRYYLLVAVILSVLIPLLRIPIDFREHPTNSDAIWRTLSAVSAFGHERVSPMRSEVFEKNIFTWSNILRFAYFLIASVVLVRLLTGVLYIRKLLRRNKVERIGNIYFVSTAEPGTPFSFLRWLFWNNKIDLQSEQGHQIFRHELFHIQQRHSWDLAFMELVSLACWINPFFYLIKKELRTIHEFLADEFATSEKDKWTYAQLLLMQVLDVSRNHFVNPFLHNQIKRRIAMITSSNTPKYQFFRKLMVLPVTLVVFALFAFKVKHEAKFNLVNAQPVIAAGNTALASKLLSSISLSLLSDTAKPKVKQKAKAKSQEKEIDGKKTRDENEAIEFKKMMEEKQQEMQKAQQEFRLLMMQRQQEMQRAQEEFRKQMETHQLQGQQEAREMFKQLTEERQREAEKHQEEFKKMMTMKQQDAEKTQEEFRKMMEARQHETEQIGQQKFKELTEQKRKEAENFQQEFNRLMMMRQREAERSQEEFRRMLEQRQQEIQRMQEEFQKRMLEKNRKQVI